MLTATPTTEIKVFDIHEQLKAKYAILLYGDDNIKYAESGKVVNGRLTAFQPLSNTALKGMLRTIKVKEDYQFVLQSTFPSNLLYISPHKIVWTSESKMREIDIYGETYKVKIPTVVFMYDTQGALKVFCSKKAKVDGNTPLCHCPLMNINGSGGMCWGSNKKPNSKHAESVMKYVEQMFWDSGFTHYNHSAYANKEWYKSKPIFSPRSLKEASWTIKKFI